MNNFNKYLYIVNIIGVVFLIACAYIGFKSKALFIPCVLILLLLVIINVYFFVVVVYKCTRMEFDELKKKCLACIGSFIVFFLLNMIVDYFFRHGQIRWEKGITSALTYSLVINFYDVIFKRKKENF